VTTLLDVNVVIALVDPAHIQHDEAHVWFRKSARHGWATCPLTENGLVRILSNPKYPNSPGGPDAILQLLIALRQLEGHEFWPDQLSLADTGVLRDASALTHKHLTDAYLMALAVARGGRLATFDRKIPHKAVQGATAAIDFIG
jgi:uncharacterized protein